MFLVRRSHPHIRLAAFAGLLVAFSLGASPSPVGAGEPVTAAAPAVPPRQAALDAAIHRLERHLAGLRRSRTELESGRPEPVPADDAARRRADVDQRAVREVSRYESARGKAVAALADAVASKDAAKVGDAQAALDALDAKFVDGMKKLEESLAAPHPLPGKGVAPGTGDAQPKGDAPTKPSTNDAAKPKSESAKPKGDANQPPKKAPKPEGKTSMSEGGEEDDDSDADLDEDDDLAVEDAIAR